MAYQHIVVATDLSEDAELLVSKGARLARALSAKLSLIYIDIHPGSQYLDSGGGEFGYTDETFNERAQYRLQTLKQHLLDPSSELIIQRGEFLAELDKAINERGFDLVIIGHHHDIWSHLLSSARQAINHLRVDVLVVPINTTESLTLRLTEPLVDKPEPPPKTERDIM